MLNRIVLLAIAILCTGHLPAQSIPQMLAVGYTSTGQARYMALDLTGALAASGLGGSFAPPNGYVQPVAMEGMGTDGKFHYVLVDSTGVVQTAGSSSSSGVGSVNGLTGAITLDHSGNITLTQNGNTITIGSTSLVSPSCVQTVGGGDNTQTDCGYQNQPNNTGSYVTTLGYQNIGDLGGTAPNISNHVVGIGNNNANGLQSPQIVGIGDTNISGVYNHDVVGIGNNNLTSNTSYQAPGPTDLVAIGDVNGQGITMATSNAVLLGHTNGRNLAANNVVAIGSTNAAAASAHTYVGSNIVGIGNSSANSSSTFQDPNIVEMVAIGDHSGVGVNGDDVIAIGSASVSDFASSSSDIIGIGDNVLASRPSTCGGAMASSVIGTVAIGSAIARGIRGGANFNIGIGSFALGAAVCSITPGTGLTGTDNIAIGHFALVATSSGIGNVAIGSNAGSVGYTTPASFGNSNQTGSNNTWLGNNSGPSTTSQLTNTIALGYNAVNTASNQTVIGNSSTLEAHIFGTFFTPTSSAASCAPPQYAYDSNFAYFCTTANTWKRIALTTF